MTALRTPADLDDPHDGIPADLWERPIPTTRRAAIRWMRDVTRAFGGGYHPDDSADGYINLRTNRPTFQPDEAIAFDQRRDAAYDLLGEDIYKVGLKELRSMGF